MYNSDLTLMLVGIVGGAIFGYVFYLICETVASWWNETKR